MKVLPRPTPWDAARDDEEDSRSTVRAVAMTEAWAAQLAALILAGWAVSPALPLPDA